MGEVASLLTSAPTIAPFPDFAREQSMGEIFSIRYPCLSTKDHLRSTLREAHKRIIVSIFQGLVILTRPGMGILALF
jgi:hypothetical protein